MMPQMRVSMLSPRTIRTNAAGIEQNVKNVSQYLLKKGISVDVFCTAAHPKGKIVFEGVTLHEFPAFSPNESYFFSLPLYHALRAWEGDIIHCNGYNNLVSVVGILAKKKGQKLVITMNSSGSSSLFRQALHTPLSWFYRKYLSRIDKVICVSKWEYDYFKTKIGFPEEKLVVVPNGIETKEFDKIVVERKDNILSVGRLVKNKGMHRLLRAMPYVLKQYPSAELHIVGDGPEKETLIRQTIELGIEKNVFFHGNIPFSQRDRLLTLFKQSSVFALLTDKESQGIVFGEAMAAGLSILAVDKGVMHEYVESGAAKGITEPDVPQIVGEALVELLGQRGKPARNTEQLWNWNKVGEAVFGIYNEIMEK